MKTPFPLAALLLLPLSMCGGILTIRAGDYLGADAVLKQAEAQSDSSKGPATKKGNPIRQFHEDLQAFRDRLASLPPDQAAREWLGLFDRAVKLPPDMTLPNGGYSGPVPPYLTELFQTLPPPPAWDALSAQIAARPAPDKGSADFSTPVLRVVAGMLQGQPDAVRQGIDALRQQAENVETSQQDMYRQGTQSLQEAFLTLASDKAAILANFEAKLALLKPGSGSSPDRDTQMTMMRANTLEVPNLVALAGPARAEALFRQMFALPLRDINIRDARTKALARQVALTMDGQLKFAPWSLVDSIDATALYELIQKHADDHPDQYPDQYRRQQADAYYLLGLIVQGRRDDAAALALELGKNARHGEEDALGGIPEQALGDLAAKGYAKEVYDFFGRLLDAHPESPYWTSFTSAAVLAGETDAMLARIKTASERTDLKPLVRTRLRTAYGDALLAADHVSEALPILRAAAVAASQHPAEGPTADNAAGPELQPAANLVGISGLLGDKALLNEQLDLIVKTAKNHPGAVTSLSVPGSEGLARVFLDAGRGPEMEQLLVGRLAQARREAAARRAQMQQGGYSGVLDGDVDFTNRGTQEPLYALVDLYYHADRFADIVFLLDHARDWDVDDLAKLIGSRYGSSETFGYQAARALQKTGNTDAALRTVNAFLENHGGSDPAYALLLELLPPDQAEARLNALFQADQFEERPLIWRASLQLAQNRLDEAEKSARQAIAIDPSDGEEGRGDRMRAYAVLGDILERKGDGEKAALMRRAVQAIRLSEDADEYHSAGLLTRAVGMYEKALGYFADAYCIQSRLAIQLTALGKLDEAAAHYERAYELMPESFGRMESHCFGCERAFAGERAQHTAERVFQKLVAAQPANPRVHYLLGYLRGEEERNAEAAQEFREAVRLDPDYINAWKQLAANTDDPADRDHAALNLLRLDPRHKHDSADLTTVSDLRALWAAVEAAQKFASPPAANLYPLAASKEAIEQERPSHPKKPSGNSDPVSVEMLKLSALLDPDREPLTPRSAILKNTVITQSLQILSSSNFPLHTFSSTTDE